MRSAKAHDTFLQGLDYPEQIKASFGLVESVPDGFAVSF
jgi:hypothetical protein